MLADEAAGGRERIILTDQPDGIRVPPFAHKRHVAGNVHVSRTERHAGHRLVVCTCTASVLNMPHIVVPVTDQSLVHHIGCFIANGTVCGLHDGKGSFFHQIQGFHCGFPAQNVADQLV